jgi:alkanesulfonate monooxygenase
MTQPRPRFGIWTLVSGALGSRFHPDEHPDASWERNKALVLEAERLGYETTLLAQHTYRKDAGLEAWMASAALAAITDRIEIIAAIKPALYHPVVLAKMALQAEEISGGRFAINYVNAFLKPEIERAGLPFLEHDERYAYGREWMEIVEPLLRGETVSYKGRYFTIDEYFLLPKDAFRERPPIYMGGESEAARQLVADMADVWFINGQPVEKVAELVDDVLARPRDLPALRLGLSAFVIARATEEEAQAALEYAWELDAKDRGNYEAFVAQVDPNVKMFQKFAEYPHIGTNGGTAAGLVGSYDTVAARIMEFNDLGIETFMLQFQPFEAEMRRFASEVIPRVRRLSTVVA